MEELTGEIDISHLRQKVDLLSMVRTRIAELKEQEKQLVAEIRGGTGMHQFGLVDGQPAVRVDARTNSHLDKDMVKGLLGPEVFGTVVRLTPYTTLRLLGRFK